MFRKYTGRNVIQAELRRFAKLVNKKQKNNNSRSSLKQIKSIYLTV